MYYHKVLEAKIVFSDNVVISLGTELISLSICCLKAENALY